MPGSWKKLRTRSFFFWSERMTPRTTLSSIVLFRIVRLLISYLA